jgi:hypothetical protein
MKTALPAAVAALLLAASCAAPAVRPARSAGFAEADVQRARRLSPDLYARAERARAEALAVADADREGHADLERKTRLLLAAAIAEARRIELERAAAASEAEAARAQQKRALLTQERLALEQEHGREQSARAERAHAARVFEGGSKLKETRAEDAAFLLRRAALLLAAASSLGLPETRAREVAASIELARRATPAASLAVARDALRRAETALGEARALPDGSGASAEETAALIEMARERGLAAELTAGGVALGLASLFREGSAQLDARGRERIAHVAALAAAHPHGAIAIEYPAADGVGGASAHRLAHARARQVERRLAASARARVQVVAAPGGAGVSPRLVFRAYAPGS